MNTSDADASDAEMDGEAGNNKLAALTIGNLQLSPEFDSDVLTYTLNTSNNRNKVTATAVDGEADIEISLGATPFENGTYASWETGENTLTIVVTNGEDSTTYTVTVTKE